MARDYYEVLGVSRDATADQIQQAFRTLARKYHPDVNKDPAAEDRFKEVNEAYHVLSDPDTRKRYDRFGEDFRQVPEDWEERVGAGGRWLRRRRAIRRAGALRPGLRRCRRRHQHRRPFRRHVRRRWRIRADSGRRPGSGAGADRRGGLPGRQTADSHWMAATTGSTFPRVSSTVSEYGWRERAAGVAAMDRPEICTCGCASSRIPDSGSTDATSPSICRCRRGRRCWGPLLLFELPAAKRKLRCRKGRRPAGGCGCAAKACPTRAVPPATSTQKSR